MNLLLRASVVAALALAALDGRAETRRPCVTTLEAQAPQEPGTPPPKKPCVLAIAYASPSRTVVARRGVRERAPAAAVASVQPGARA